MDEKVMRAHALLGIQVKIKPAIPVSLPLHDLLQPRD